MPQINPWRPTQFSAAFLGGVVSVDGRAIYPPSGSATGCEWLTPDSLVTSHYGTGLPFRLVEIDLNGNERRTLSEGPPFNHFGAGGGHWWIVTAGGVIIDGTNTGFHFAPIVYGCGPDGTIAYFPWNGQGLWLLRPTGEVTHLSDAACQDVQVHGWNAVSWREGAQIRTVGLEGFPTPQTVWPAFGWLRTFRVEGVWWLAYQVFDHPTLSVIAHPAHDASQGKILSTGLGWRLDASSHMAVWSTINRDLPQDIQRVLLADLPMVPFNAPPPPPPPDDEEPMPEVPNLFEIVQAVWAKYGGDPFKRGAMVNEIAWRGNGNKADGPWGLSRKTGGANAEQPGTGEKVAHDIVQYGPTRSDGLTAMFDVFTDSGPIWAEAHQHNDMTRIWIPAVAPSGVVPEPDPDDPPPPSGQSRIERDILDLVVGAFMPMAETVEKLELEVRELKAKVAELGQDIPGPGFPTQVAIKSSRGRYLRDDWGDDTGKFDKDVAGSGETYTLEPK